MPLCDFSLPHCLLYEVGMITANGIQFLYGAFHEKIDNTFETSALLLWNLVVSKYTSSQYRSHEVSL